MRRTDLEQVLAGEVLDAESEITLVELCRTCAVQAETIESLVDYGIIEPAGRRGTHWCFQAGSIRRARVAMRLQRDLGVNLAGAALALELLERIDELDARLRRDRLP